MAARDNETDLLAGERALGLEGTAGETRREADARAAWEARFAPLADALGPADPPPGLLAAIENRIAAEDASEALKRAQRSVSRWQAATAVTGLAAAAAVALAVVSGSGTPLPAPDDSGRFVAVVRSDANPDQPGMIVHIDLGRREATVVPVIGPAPSGRSYEMWHLREGAQQPYSLGLLPGDAARTPITGIGPGDTVAISLEPEGGSPTGQPTQALFHGTVQRVGE